MSYKLLSYHAGRKEIRAGILVGDHVYDAARVDTDTSYATMEGVLRNWKKAHSAFVACTKNIESGKSRAKGIALKKVRLAAPVPVPGAAYSSIPGRRSNYGFRISASWCTRLFRPL